MKKVGKMGWKLGALLLAAVLCLGGCGAPANETDSGTEEITLKFFGWKMGAEEGNIMDIIADFEAAHEGVTVEYEAIPTSNGYDDVITSRLAAKDTADVFMGNATQTELYLEAGYIEDLSDQPWVERVNDTLIENLNQDGKMYSMPLENSGIGLFSNTNMLQELNIAIPETWGEFLDACETIKQAGKTPIVMGDKSGWSALRIYFQDIGNMAVEDPNLGYDVAEGKKKPSEALISPIEKYATLVEKGYTNGEAALGMQWNDQALTEFVGGNYGFFFGGTWLVNQMQEVNPNFQYQLSPLPVNEEGKPYAYLMTGTSLFVNKDSKYKDLAKEFLNFWAQPEYLNAYTKSQSAFTSMVGGESYEHENLKIFADAFKEGRVCTFPRGLEFADNLNQPAYKGMQMILMGQGTVEDTGKDMDEQLQKSITLKK